MPELGHMADFNLDWRMTANPKIHDHGMDLDFLMDIGPDQSRCTMAHDEHNYTFLDVGD